MSNYLYPVITGVLNYLRADWYILLLGTMVAVVFSVYVDANKLRKFLHKRAGVSISSSLALAALTPLCACGTIAVIIGMFVAKLPWAPVMAFLITSPLAGPATFLFQLSLFGTEFAVFSLISAIAMGYLAGIITYWLERKSLFFADQFKQGLRENCCHKETDSSLCPSPKVSWIDKYKIKEVMRATYQLGVKKILVYFIAFVAIGQVVELLLPPELVLSLFGSNRGYSVPLAATLGLPFYISGPSALPVLKAFVDQGADLGPILAFMIAGKATGIPVLIGMSYFIKPKVLGLYVILVFLGAILSGYFYQFFANGLTLVVR